MATVFLCPMSAIFQWFNDAGIVLSGGKINTYLAGTTTPTNTYTDQTGITLNSNPLILGSNGRMVGVQIWQPQGISLKLVITDANNVQLGPVFDQITGINDPSTVQTLYANPATGFGADLIANAMRSYGIVSEVRAANVPTLSAGQTLAMFIEGQVALGDEDAGFFYWSATSNAVDDGHNVIKPTAAGATGRYLRYLSGASQIVVMAGFTASVQPSLAYYKANGVISMHFGAATGTSNAVTMTAPAGTLLPFDRPKAALTIPMILQDNGVVALGQITVNTDGSLTFGKAIGAAGGFTAAGSKGIPLDTVITFPLN